MGKLWNSIKNVVRGKRDEMADSMKDDVRDGKFAIEDSEKQISEFRTQIAKFDAEIRKQKRSQDSLKAEVKKWASLAKKAAEAGSESDVATAVTEKNRAAGQLKVVEQEIAQNDKVLITLKTRMRDAQSKVQKAKGQFSQLEARKRGADIRKSLSSVSSDFDGGSALSKLDALNDAVEAAECEAEAMEDMAGEGAEAVSLEAKYSTAGDSAVDDEVAKLMAAAKK